MKVAHHLLVSGFLACGLLAGACVSGQPVMGGGGQTGSGGAHGGGQGGSSNGQAGHGVGGTIGAGVGGFTAGIGGFTGGGQGGATVVTGTGGATTAGCPRTNVLIDNFDDPMRGGPATGGYFNFNCAIGSWYVYGDTSPQPPAMVVPPFSSVTPFTSSTPGNGGTGAAAHINGSGFSVFGIGMGVNINSSGATVGTYNGSVYSGFTFWAMGTTAGSRGANMVRVAVPIPASSTPANGGTCVATTTTYCDGHWGKVIALSTVWTQYTVKWSELALDTGAIGGTAFSPATIIGFHWQVDGVPATPASMNIWVDDLAFTP